MKKIINVILFSAIIFGKTHLVQGQEVAQMHLVSAKEYFKQKNFKLSLIELDSAIKLSPNYAELYELKGDIFSLQNEERKSIGQYSLAILHNSNSPQLYLKRAALHYKLKDHRNYILNDLNKAIAIEPYKSGLYQLKGYYYAHTFNPNTLKPDYENAIISLTKAISINSNVALYYYYRSDYKLKNKQNLSSLIDINKAIELDNTKDVLYHQRATIKFVMADFRSSLTDINQALLIKDNSITYFQFRGNVFYNLKKYDRSYDDYSIAISLIFNYISNSTIRIKPNSSINLQLRRTLLLRGMASVQGNKPFDGCDDFNRALKMGESKAKNYINQYCN